ncbi:MAG TPA: hypothetical protein VK187_07460 [Geobacteraceae bacterium]|nr:hypothetical protein [Geobacteraceae bacterium]
MNRNIVLAIIFPVTFFLVFLGVRNPDLNGNSRPKPRPRAVLENLEKLEKAPLESFSKHQLDAEPCQVVSVHLSNAVFGPFDQEVRSVVLHGVDRSHSRAPPFSSPSLS